MAVAPKTAGSLAELSALHYATQAIWFLNGFWEEGMREEAELVWGVVKKFSELDVNKGTEGNELNEFDSHRLLEAYDATLTAIKMREALREIDVDSNKHMSVIEYLCWRYQKGVDATVTAQQGDNQEEIDACEAKLNEVKAALEDVMAKLEAQKVALAAQEAALQAQNEAIAAQDQAIAENEAALQAQREAVAANDAAVKANDAKVQEQTAAVAAADAIFQELKAAEDEVRAAEEELQAAVDALKAEEDAYNGKIAELETKSQDTSVGVVTRNKAANELQQLKAEDPLPLRRAKITAEAKVRPVTKAREAAEAKRIPAEEKKQELEAIQAQLEETQRQLEEAQRELEAKEAALAETQRQLEEKKAELEEAKARLEEAKRQLEAIVAELESAFDDLSAKMQAAQEELAAAKAKPGVAFGKLWWMERQLYEADESLPRARQQYDHSKPFEFSES
jgi:chromosome segregation ATPase